jgi:hypothetical protein
VALVLLTRPSLLQGPRAASTERTDRGKPRTSGAGQCPKSAPSSFRDFFIGMNDLRCVTSLDPLIKIRPTGDFDVTGTSASVCHSALYLLPLAYHSRHSNASLAVLCGLRKNRPAQWPILKVYVCCTATVWREDKCLAVTSAG